MPKQKKAQTAIEFFLLLGAALFFMLALTATFQHKVALKNIEKRNFLFQEMALTMQSELNIAASAADGYKREFHLPGKIAGLDYDITIVANSVYINTTDGRHTLALPAQNTTGQFVKNSNNTIEKRDGIIYVN